MPPGPTAPRSLAGLLAEFRPCFTAPDIPDLRRAGGRSDRADPPPNGVWNAHRRRAGSGVASQPRTPIVHQRPLVGRRARIGPVRSDRGPTAPGGSRAHDRGRRHLFKRSGKKVFGAAWHHDGAAKGPKPIGFGNCWVVAGIVVQLSFLSRPVCLPVLARLWRPRHTGKIAHARELAELIAARYPDRIGARGRGRRLRRGTPARPGRPDHLDQPVEGHLGAARAAPTAHRTLRAATHPRRPVGHTRPTLPPAPQLRAGGVTTRVRRYGRTDTVQITEVICLVVRIVSQPNRARDSGARRQAADSRP